MSYFASVHQSDYVNVGLCNVLVNVENQNIERKRRREEEEEEELVKIN